jgi:protein involved in polysaccharide export with SLBB domain
MNKKIILSFLLFYLSINIYPQILDSRLSNQNQNILNYALISVTIGGSFPVNGTYSALLSERVDEFITRIYAEAVDITLRTSNDPEIYRKSKNELTKFVLRGIKLKRTNGEEMILDLEKFRITGDFKYNPHLMNDDVIIFPQYDLDRNFISVYGAVNRPGVFYFIEGDRLKDALELVNGVNPAFENIDSVEISRLSYDGQTQTFTKVGINDDIELMRGDRLRIIAQESKRINFSVLVLGEINFPGTIPITKDNTNLYEVIQLAGGFTSQASLKRARVFKNSSLSIFLQHQYGLTLAEQPNLEDPKIRNILLNLEAALMYRMSNVVSEDTTYFYLENQLRVFTEGSSLDFNKIGDPESDIAKYKVTSGDIIVIPPIQNSVYVFGQVLRPGHVTFIEEKDYTYYVNEASGLGELAEADDIMVIKGGSRAWISPIRENVVIEEGDYIYVPKQNLRSFRSYVFEYSVYVSLLASIAAILLSIVTIVNQ